MSKQPDDLREIVTSTHALVTQLVDQNAKLRQEMIERFEKVDQRFEEVDKRFEKVDQRFERVEWRLDTLEASVSTLNKEVLGFGVELRSRWEENVLRREDIAARVRVLEKHHATSDAIEPESSFTSESS